MRSLAFLFFLIALCTAAHGQATTPLVEGFHTSASHSDYDLAANSIPALLAEKNEKGPMDHGRRFFANTHWDLRWNYRYERKKGRFAITVLSVTTAIRYTMPRRALPPSEQDHVAGQWARFITALTAHENGHAENAIQHGKALYALLREPRAFASAEALKEFVSAEGARCIAETHAADEEYDHKTDHGATQGASLR